MLSRAPYSHRRSHWRPQLTAFLLVALAPLVAPVSARAQSAPEKRTLEIADYAEWRTISGSTISDDGRWVA